MANPLRITHIEPSPDWIRGIYDAAFEDSQFELVWASEVADGEIGESTVLITGKRRVTATIIKAAVPHLRLIQVVGRAPWAVWRCWYIRGQRRLSCGRGGKPQLT